MGIMMEKIWYQANKIEDVCPKCGKKFYYIVRNQIPGFRDTEYKVCPYCKEVLAESMEVEWETYGDDTEGE